MGKGLIRLYGLTYTTILMYYLFNLYIYTVFHYMFLLVTINFITLCYFAGNRSEVGHPRCAFPTLSPSYSCMPQTYIT